MFLMYLLLNIKYIWRLRMILFLFVSASLWWPRRPCTTSPLYLCIFVCAATSCLNLQVHTSSPLGWIFAHLISLRGLIPSSPPGLHLKLCFYNYLMGTHIHIHKLLPFPDLLISIECFLIWYYILQLQLKCKF